MNAKQVYALLNKKVNAVESTIDKVEPGADGKSIKITTIDGAVFTVSIPNPVLTYQICNKLSVDSEGDLCYDGEKICKSSLTTEEETLVKNFSEVEGKLLYKNKPIANEQGDGATADWVTNITAGGLASGTDVTGLTALEIVKKITRKYANATCSVTWSITDSLIEQGTTFDLTVSVNNFRNGDYAPSKVALYDGSTLVEQKVVSGATITFTTINNISTNKTYSVKLTDANNVITNVASKTYTFAYPIYYGVVNNGATLDATAIKGLSKVLSSATTITQSFTANFQTIVFATTKNLTNIVNQNGYSVLGNATKQTVLVDGTNFNVYTLANINVANFKYDFKF